MYYDRSNDKFIYFRNRPHTCRLEADITGTELVIKTVTLYIRIRKVLDSDLGRDPDNSHSVNCSILINLCPLTL
jgi:hypothetical protein